MADQTAIGMYERGEYSDDYREHRDGDGTPLCSIAPVIRKARNCDGAGIFPVVRAVESK